MAYNHLQITLSEEEQDALAKLAKQERRYIKDQAALLIIEGLEQRGLLVWPKKQIGPENPPASNDNLIAGK